MIINGHFLCGFYVKEFIAISREKTESFKLLFWWFIAIVFLVGSVLLSLNLHIAPLKLLDSWITFIISV